MLDQVEVVDGDAADPAVIYKALEGSDVAYYLIHSLLMANDFEQSEVDLARLFATTAKATGVRRVVYLGGIVNDGEEHSSHVSARHRTGEILRSSGVPTIELRADVVIGSGSASFEMLRYLTEQLRIMTTPKWVQNRIQPIAVRDVLRYLVGAAAVDESVSGAFNIGGPDVFSYAEMMQQYAKAVGLRKVKSTSVETRWTNASVLGTPSEPLPTDPDWAGGSH